MLLALSAVQGNSIHLRLLLWFCDNVLHLQAIIARLAMLSLHPQAFFCTRRLLCNKHLSTCCFDISKARRLSSGPEAHFTALLMITGAVLLRQSRDSYFVIVHLKFKI